MKKNSKNEMQQVLDEIGTVKGFSTTYSGDVDYPDDVPFIEDLSNPVSDENEELNEEELEAFLENIDFQRSDTGLSFDDMMPKPVIKTGVTYQRKENVVTPHFLVLRDLVKKTPSVCIYRDCFYDGAKAIGYKNWDKTPESKRRIALMVLERHVKMEHKFRDTDIIDEAQIPSSWLSSTMP